MATHQDYNLTTSILGEALKNSIEQETKATQELKTIEYFEDELMTEELSDILGDQIVWSI